MTVPVSPKRTALLAAARERILVLDGAMGTMLQQRNLTAADFGGPALEGCNESLNRTRPDVVLAIHRAYLTAGSDAIETNTFCLLYTSRKQLATERANWDRMADAMAGLLEAGA